MPKTWDMYKTLDTPDHLEMCPCCASKAELVQYSESATAPTEKVVCCTNGDPIGPQHGGQQSGCLLYLPPENHYRPTAREAVKYWNEYAKALTSQQRVRRWERAQVLRSNKRMETSA